MKKYKIVFCGSMKIKDQIVALSEELTTRGYEVIIPAEIREDMTKSDASRRHFDRIIKDADAVFVVNATAHDTENYIGPNSFAEIAFAFYFKKPIFLWHDIYAPYRDELEAWNAIPLKGDLNKLMLQ